VAAAHRNEMRLTSRQRDVVALLDAGLSCPQIARRLGIALNTVRAHVRVIAAQVPGELPALRRVKAKAKQLLEAAA
jgi:DNA-binding NarL/FixJ family response regulator